MARNQLSFFATKSDLVSLLRIVESATPLQFVVAGLFDSPHIESLQSLLDDRNLGQVAVGSNNLAVSYLVAIREVAIEVRSVPQRNGGVKYAVDQRANPKAISFRPGGAFGEGCLIDGQMGTVSDDSSSLALFQLFGKEIRRQLPKIKSFHVGKEASELLDKGWRLTQDTTAPPLYDLKRD